MEIFKDKKTCIPASRKDWRKWLEKHHASETAVFLVLFHQRSTNHNLTYAEAVEEALCFGWIDSVAYKRDTESNYQLYTPRKPKSKWSKSNRERVEKLSAQGLMRPAGQAMVDLARETGTWLALEAVENLIIPDDLRAALKRNQTAAKHFDSFPRSSKRVILEWIQNAKKPETQVQRIKKTVELARDNIRANHPKPKS